MLWAEHRGQRVGTLLDRGQWRPVVAAEEEEALRNEQRCTLRDVHTKTFIKVTKEHSP